MIESSYILKPFIVLLKLFIKIISQSAILFTIMKAVQQLFAWVLESAIVKKLAAISTIDSQWKMSKFHKFFIYLLDLPNKCILWIADNGTKSFSQSYIISLVIKLYKFMACHMHILLGLFIFVMTVIPFTYWNNFYAFGCILFLFVISISKKRPSLGTNVYLIFFMIMTTLAFVFSINLVLSLRFFIFYVNCFLLLYIVITELNTYAKFNVFIHITLFGIFLTGIYGIYQNFIGIPVLASQVDVSIDSNLVGRVYSTIGNANNYAELLVMFLPFFVATFLNSKKIVHKVFYTIIMIPCLISLLLTYSRSSWIGLVVAVGMFIMLKKWRLIPVFGLIGLAIFPLLPITITRRIMTIFSGDSSTNMRFIIWKQTVPLIKDYWVTGIGLGPDVFIEMMKNYQTIRKAVHAHNIFLQILVETGILGLVSFLALKVHLFKQTVTVVLNKKIDMAYKNHIIAAISSIFGLLVVALVEYIWHEHRIMLIYWLMVGLLIASLRNANEAFRSSSSPIKTLS